MIVTTTPSVEGRRITAYKGIVVGEAILGANVIRDLFAGITAAGRVHMNRNSARPARPRWPKWRSAPRRWGPAPSSASISITKLSTTC